MSRLLNGNRMNASFLALEPLALFGVGLACIACERLTLGHSGVAPREYLTDLKSLGMAVLVSAVVATGWNWATSAGQAPLDLRPWRVIGAIVAFDVALYGLHRIGHSAAWPIHRRHHTAKHFEASMAFRDSWAHLIIYAVLLRAFGLAFDLSAPELAVLSSVFIAFQWWSHLRVPVSLGVLDFILIGPRHHSLHHRHERRAWSKNLGGLFCAWDQLFGTYAHPF